MDNQLIRHIPWLAWMCVVAVLSFIPGDQLPAYQFDWISIDTLVHFIMYAVLATFQLWAFQSWLTKDQNKLNLLKLRLYGLVILIGFCFGTAVELIQGNFIYRRYFDPYDIITNLFGTIFVVFTYHLLSKKFIKN